MTVCLPSRRLACALLWLMLLLVGPVSVARGQGEMRVPGYTVTHFAGTPGVPTGVWALLSDADGYLWIGSTDGLFRFDGFVFESWSELSRDALAGSTVRALLADAAGEIWVGFDSGGVTRIHNGQARNYGAADGLRGSGVRALAIDATGTVWAGSRQGLFSFGNDRWSSHPRFEGTQVTSLLVDPTGTLWVGTTDALYRAQGQHADFLQVARVPDNPYGIQGLCLDTAGRVVRTDARLGFDIVGGPPPSGRQLGIGVRVLCGRGGDLWVATAFAGLWHVPASLHPRPDKIATELLTYGALALLEHSDGSIWVGAIDGLYRLTPQPVTNISDIGVVVAVMSDRDDGMWVGTFDGVRHFTRRRGTWRPDGAYLRGTRTRAMHVTADHMLWVSMGDGIASISRDGIERRPAWGAGLDQVESIASDAHGTLWMFDRRKGLFRVNGNQATPLGLPGERGSARTVVRAGRGGQTWVVNDTLVAQLNKSGRVGLRYGASEGLPPPAVDSVYEDRTGALWLGGMAAVSRITEGRMERLRIPLVQAAGLITTIAQSSDGEFWLGAGDQIIRFPEAAFDRAIARGSPTLDGFSVFDRLSSPIRTLNNSGSALSPDGSLWYVTDEGVTVIDPVVAVTPPVEVASRITAVDVDDRRFDRTAFDALGAGVARISIRFSARDLVAPHRLRFRYRLEGFDPDWIDAAGRRAIDYTNLPPGAYVFHVTATRDGNAWPEPGATWAFTIAPRFYESGWFAIGVCLAVGGTTYGAWRLRLATVRRRLALVLAERARVSREIHDTLLQGYVGVALELQGIAQSQPQGQLTSRILRVRERIDEHIEEAREAIWNLRSPVLDRLTLADAIRQAGSAATAGTNITFEVEECGPPLPGPSRVERELLLVAQEAITNAVRHARPGFVRVSLRTGDGAVRLIMVDDGCGFEPGPMQGGHLGFASMRERVEGLGGELSIVSANGAGTRIEAVVPLVAE